MGPGARPGRRVEFGVALARHQIALDDFAGLPCGEDFCAAGLGIGKDREYFETNEGKLVDAKGIKARYVRLYSKGSTYQDPLNR